MSCLCVLFWFYIVFNSHITTMSGYERVGNAHSYSGALLNNQVQDALRDTIPSHRILTLGQPMSALV